MKKILLTLGVSSLLAMSAQASIILSNSFAYPDGSLTNVSSGSPLGVWTNHSGSGVLDVASGAAQLSQLNAPDVSSPLAGGPYSSGILYASFTINVSTLPGGSGTYFFHFRDTGTQNFRGRVFLTTTNAGTGVGAFRAGVTAGSTTNISVVPVDMLLGTQYKLVVRYNTATAATTLWLNPTSESAVTGRADFADVPGSPIAPPITSVCLRQSGSNPGMGVLAFDDLLIGTAFSDVQTIGGPPSISGLGSVSIPANTNTGPMPFIISDVEDPAASLTVAATSDNTTLVPNNPANLAFGGSGGSRTLTVTPAINQQGTANIQVVVTDTALLKATNNFTITVGLPTISSVPNQIALTNTVTGPIVYTVFDNETAAGSLTVTATSSDQAVLPDANIAIINGGGTRSLFLTNIAPGNAIVTVSVNDGTFTVSTTNALTAYPTLGVLMADSFGYTDGPVTTNSSFLWQTHSASTGQTGQTQVATGKLLLTNNASEDISRFFTNAPVLNTSGTILHSRFIVNFSGLPTANGVGEYFGHFREASGGNFRARLFSTTNGVTAGKLKLAIANGGFITAVHPTELSLNTDYVVITRFNTGTSESTLWVSPASESSTSVTATDPASLITTYTYAFRQQSGIGSLSIDDLVIGSTFSEVFTSLAPAPIALTIQSVGNNAVLTWANPAFNLQAAPEVTGTYTNIPSAASPYTNAASGTQRYFRLKYP